MGTLAATSCTSFGSTNTGHPKMYDTMSKNAADSYTKAAEHHTKAAHYAHAAAHSDYAAESLPMPARSTPKSTAPNKRRFLP